MRSPHAVFVSLTILASTLLAGCNELVTAPDRSSQPPAPTVPSFDVAWAGADVYESTTSDTTVACRASTSCRDLNPSEADEVLGIVNYLLDSGNFDCRETGLRLNQLLVGNRIKVAGSPNSAPPGITIYDPDPLNGGATQCLIFQPTLFGSLFENRFVVVHEGYHARGNVSTLGFPSDRKLQNESLYDPAANQHAQDCS